MKGRLGKQVLAANTDTVVYQANSNIAYADVNINVLNPTSSDATISIAIAPSPTSPLPIDFIEQNLVLTGDGSTLIRGNEIIGKGEYIILRSNVAGVVVRISGKECIN